MNDSANRFLYRGREVSYSSVLAQSISRRRDVLYKSRGLDIIKWEEMVAEKRALNKEISRIAEDYEDRLPREKSQEEAEELKEEKMNELPVDPTVTESTAEKLAEMGKEKPLQGTKK